MRVIKYSSKFKKDLRRELKNPQNKGLDAELNSVLNLLCQDISLPIKNHDHALRGNMIGLRDCHLKTDLILIYYKVDNDLLCLERLGSHSEIL